MNSAPVSAGQVIGGRYALEAQLGQGGMAVVYRARHTGTGKPCAIKLVHPHLVTRRELVDLFIREAQVGGRIGPNPHIVDVFDAGADEARGVPYLAMELLEGQTLSDHLKLRGPMDRPLFRNLMAQLADALDQAHKAGVIHRDLKPSNLFLTTDRRGEPLLKVLDFGIAKILEEEAQRTATQIGTPAYAAPEQMGPTLRRIAETQGVIVASTVSPATDVWSLGLIAYEMLTGLPTGQYWGVDSLAELPAKVALEEAGPATARAADRAGLLPPGFDAWFARCMRRNAADRWASAGQAVAELGRLLDAPSTLYGAPLGSAAVPPTNFGAGATQGPGYGAPPPAPWGGNTGSPYDVRTPAPGPYGGPPAGFDQPVPVWGAPTPYAPPPQYFPPAPTQASAGGGSGKVVGVIIGVVVGLIALFVVVAVVAFRAIDRDAAVKSCEHGNKRCDDACNNGDLKSCTRYGWLLERGEGVPRDVPKAATVYDKACDGGDLHACANLGIMHYSGRGGLKKDAVKAVSFYKKACDGDELFGCDLLGEMYESGLGGLKKDEVRALGLYQQACDGGELRGCKDVGWMNEAGLGGLSKNEIRAAQLYKKGCDGGDMPSCTNLGVMYEGGRGALPKDATRAVELYQKGCDDQEERACRFLGWMYEQGKGVSKDEAKAVKLYRDGCDGGDMLACNNLGVMYENGRGGLPKDEQQAIDLYKKACDQGDMLGCNNVGVIYEGGRAGLPKDDLQAVKYYQMACDGNDMHGCRNLGGMFESGKGVSKDEIRAVALYRQACEGADGRACVSLGWMYEMGHGGLAKDDHRAGELYLEGCNGGDAIGCNNYGVMLESARGGLAKDERHAAKLYEQACDGGSINACSSFGWFLYQGKIVPMDKERGVTLLRKGCAGGNSWGCDRLKETGAKP